MKKKIYKLTDHLPEAEKRFIDIKRYEISFRRWLVSQIDSGYIDLETAKKKFSLPSFEYKRIVRLWQERYSEIFQKQLTMLTSKELADNDSIRNRIKELEEKLELSNMRVIALQAVIDVAEHDLKIDIKKKFGQP